MLEPNCGPLWFKHLTVDDIKPPCTCTNSQRSLLNGHKEKTNLGNRPWPQFRLILNHYWNYLTSYESLSESAIRLLRLNVDLGTALKVFFYKLNLFVNLNHGDRSSCEPKEASLLLSLLSEDLGTEPTNHEKKYDIGLCRHDQWRHTLTAL